MFETVVRFDKPHGQLAHPRGRRQRGRAELPGRASDLHFVCEQAMRGTETGPCGRRRAQHRSLRRTPSPRRSTGELIYFFELRLRPVSGYLLGVNPFDQPGVEAYKKNMFALLDKPGYADLRADLLKRLGDR